MQFLFEGRVCLRGKDLRVWSAARPEIQSTYVAAMDFLRVPATVPDSGAGASGLASSSASAQDKKVSPLELAKLLCESFVAPPVQTLVMGDDESAALRRVATIMSTEYATVAVPLKDFLSTQMKMPVMMRGTLVACVRTLPACLFESRFSSCC